MQTTSKTKWHDDGLGHGETWSRTEAGLKDQRLRFYMELDGAWY